MLRSLLLVVAGFTVASSSAAAAECHLQTFAQDVPDVIALEGRENWVQALARAKQCELSQAGILETEVFSDDRVPLGKVTGILMSPDSAGPYLALVQPGDTITRAVPAHLASPATWNSEVLVVERGVPVVEIDSSWKKLDLDPGTSSSVLAALFSPYDHVEIDFSSTPSGATVWIAQEEVGRTVTSKAVSAGVLNTVKLTLSGYRDCTFADGDFSRPGYGRARFSCDLLPK